jgi:hypothetical protein
VSLRSLGLLSAIINVKATKALSAIRFEPSSRELKTQAAYCHQEKLIYLKKAMCNFCTYWVLF